MTEGKVVGKVDGDSFGKEMEKRKEEQMVTTLGLMKVKPRVLVRKMGFQMDVLMVLSMVFQMVTKMDF